MSNSAVKSLITCAVANGLLAGENFLLLIHSSFFVTSPLRAALLALMCAEKTGGFNLVNYRHSSGVYHEQETEDLHRRI